jgi:hypothetical protein
MRRINWKIIFLASVLLGALTIDSFLGAWSYDDGHHGRTETIQNAIFSVMRFPVHTLFWNFISKDSVIAIAYPLGLLVNVLFYAFLLERTFYILARIKRAKTNQ